MKIVQTRRVSQVFFFAMFVWFCVVSSVGERWFEIRGWPVNWFLQLDPLAAIGTVLTTHSLYKGLAWAVVTVVLTIIFGRFFCGWVCPFGALQELMNKLAKALKIPQVVVPWGLHERLWALKYIIFLALLGFSMHSLVLAERLAEFPNVKDINDGFTPGKEQLDFRIKPSGESRTTMGMVATWSVAMGNSGSGLYKITCE